MFLNAFSDLKGMISFIYVQIYSLRLTSLKSHEMLGQDEWAEQFTDVEEDAFESTWIIYLLQRFIHLVQSVALLCPPDKD